MSNLTYVERRKLEQFLRMSSVYVLDVSNRTFAEFVRERTGRNIYDRSYDHASGSKANRLRAFWQKEENLLVGKLLNDMLDYSDGTGEQKEVCRLIVAHLLQRDLTPQPGSGSQNLEQQLSQQRRSQALGQLKDEFSRQ